MRPECDPARLSSSLAITFAGSGSSEATKNGCAHVQILRRPARRSAAIAPEGLTKILNRLHESGI